MPVLHTTHPPTTTITTGHLWFHLYDEGAGFSGVSVLLCGTTQHSPCFRFSLPPSFFSFCGNHSTSPLPNTHHTHHTTLPQAPAHSINTPTPSLIMVRARLACL